MKKYILYSVFFFSVNSSFSQARLVMNNNVDLVIDNGAFLVIDNPNANAITLAGTGGRIKSESEGNRVRWRIGTATGTYVVPFADNASEGGTKIPLTMNIGTAGAGTGYFDFSTYDGSTWNNQLYMPSMVTHMGQYNAPNAVNHSSRAIDRFWIMNPIGYSTKPTSSLIFTYIDNEHSAAGNVLVESNLGAQRFNNGPNLWGDMLPIGTANTGANTVSTPFVSHANFFAAWTLSSISDPLSVQLLSFSANCSNQQVKLKWKTASEQNASHFQVFKSTDMNSWEMIYKVQASGNSNVENTYEFQETELTREIAYYQLVEYDFNGNSEVLKTVSENCISDNSYHVSLFPNPNQGNFSIQVSSNEKLEGMVVNLLDLTGRLLKQEIWNADAGVTDFNMSNLNLSSGSYVIQVKANQKDTQLIRFVVN